MTRISTAGTPLAAAARRTPNPSVASTGYPAPPPTRAAVAIGAMTAPGKAVRAASTSAGDGVRWATLGRVEFESSTSQ
jgi:hypothetical protein